MFLYLLRHSQAETLTVKKVTHLLKPEFSEEGTNSRKFENAVYSQFLKYLREVASKIYLNKMNNLRRGLLHDVFAVSCIT